MNNTAAEKEYWSARYAEQRTGWDIGSASTPLRAYIDQLTDKDLKILIPGAGNSYEAEYLFKQGFTNVFVLDIAPEPLAALQKRIPDFPSSQLMEGNFFTHQGQYDLILEQTFFCSFPPTTTNRSNYAKQMHELLANDGKLVGLWFDFPLTGSMEKRPFGGTKDEYLQYLSPYFKVNSFAPAYNSIPPRAGKELFGIFKKKNVL
ncbi:MAG: methyltransferase domain-containing protein [Saprospiraceae bacterium]